jgi:hypothetical protein
VCWVVSQTITAEVEPKSEGLHSSTFRPDVSTFCGRRYVYWVVWMTKTVLVESVMDECAPAVFQRRSELPRLLQRRRVVVKPARGLPRELRQMPGAYIRPLIGLPRALPVGHIGCIE